MFKNKQIIEPGNGQRGDCYRTALSCLLELPAEEVPHFYEDAVSDEADDKWDFNKAIPAWITAWLAERGLLRIMTTISGDLPTVLHYCSMMAGGSPYLLSGVSSTGISHVIVAQGSKMIWDPSPRNVGVVGPLRFGAYLFELIARPLETVPVDYEGHQAAVELNLEWMTAREKGDVQ